MAQPTRMRRVFPEWDPNSLSARPIHLGEFLHGFTRRKLLVAVAQQKHANCQVYHRKDAADNEQRVARQPQPFDDSYGGLLEELGLAGMPVAVMEAVV